MGRYGRDRLGQPHRRHIRPVQVVYHHEQAMLHGGPSQRVHNGVEDVVPVAGFAAGRIQQGRPRLAQLPQDLQPRPVRRRPLTLQTGTPRRPHARTPSPVHQLVSEGRLAGAGLPLDQHRCTTTGASGLEPTLEEGYLARTTDQGIASHGHQRNATPPLWRSANRPHDHGRPKPQ